MSTTEYIQISVADLNNTMIEDVKVLNQSQMAWKPAPNANPIGFLFWHFMRVQDDRIQGLQGKPSLWESEKWYQKLGLDAKATGSGFKAPEVDKIAALPLSDLLAYAQRVAQSSADYLKSLDDAKLDSAPDPARPNRTIAVSLRNFLIAHGWWHAGEIKYVKGMQDMPAPH